MAEEEIGRVAHYFSKAKVAAIEITRGELAVGDTIRILGHTTDFTQKVESMQVKHAAVTSAKVGDKIGIQVADHAREKDKVYKVLPD
jgi:putative protease